MTTETFAKQYPIALAAIGAHIQAHDLTPPSDIYTVDTFQGGRITKALRLHIPGLHAQQAWLASVHLDALETEPMGGGDGTRYEWFVRLPDTGIRVQLLGFRHTAAGLVSA